MKRSFIVICEVQKRVEPLTSVSDRKTIYTLYTGQFKENHFYYWNYYFPMKY